MPSSSPVPRSSAVKPFLALKKNPATGMRCGVKKLAGCGQPMELYKKRLRARYRCISVWRVQNSKAGGSRPANTARRRTPCRRSRPSRLPARCPPKLCPAPRPVAALGLRNGRVQRTALQCRYDAIGVLSIGFIGPFNADTCLA
jgi:hypothetical protein